MIGIQLHSTTALNDTSTVSRQKRRDLTWKTNVGKSNRNQGHVKTTLTMSSLMCRPTYFGLSVK